MPVAPTPDEIYERSAQEGERRLSSSTLDLVSTGFIAGFTVVYGVVALGLAHGLVASVAGDEIGKLAGSLAFGIGFVFTVVGRAELFTENFLDPVAAAITRRGSSSWARIARLWLLILVLNLVGGGVLAWLMTTPGALPSSAGDALASVATEIDGREMFPSFANAVGAGALITLMTYLLQGCDSVGTRITVAYLVGFFLALGPFNHVVVTALQLFVGMRFGADIGIADLASSVAVSTAGNIVGGLLFVTLTQTARAKS